MELDISGNRHMIFMRMFFYPLYSFLCVHGRFYGLFDIRPAFPRCGALQSEASVSPDSGLRL
jgi:hypothetical protein